MARPFTLVTRLNVGGGALVARRGVALPRSSAALSALVVAAVKVGGAISVAPGRGVGGGYRRPACVRLRVRRGSGVVRQSGSVSGRRGPAVVRRAAQAASSRGESRGESVFLAGWV